MDLRFENRVAIITGAGGGLGRSHALELARRGVRVVVNDLGGDVHGQGANASAAELVVKEIVADGGDAVANHDSVATVEGGKAIVDTALDVYGKVDIVINNAGILRDGSMHSAVETVDGGGQTPAGVGGVVATHLLGAFNVLRFAWPIMRAQGWGRVINTSSGAGMFGNFGQANYGAAKAGLAGLTRVLNVEGRLKGIKVNAIVPVAKTRMTEEIFTARNIDGSLLTPESITAVVAYLASEECAFGGELLGCGGGHVRRIFIGETRGVVIPDITAEDVAMAMEGIMDPEGFTIPPDLDTQLLDVLVGIIGANTTKA